MKFGSVFFGVLLWLAVYADQSFDNRESDGKFYTNTWAVRLDTNDEELADEVAANLGFENQGALSNLPGYFEFVHKQAEMRDKRSAEHHTRPLVEHPRVRWAKQQTLLFRHKRGFEAIDRASRFAEIKRDSRWFDDPEWPKQWYLYDTGKNRVSGNLGVLEATKLGYTGKGVVVSIVDDGLDHRHPDLYANYDKDASRDVNDNDDDPLPDDSDLDNAHGTKCGGEVAAVADNGICGVGVAYNASLGGIRMLDGRITDLTEANALGFKCDYIDIKSASWGPKDDGKTFGGPEELGAKAIKNCALHGRKGKGAIFVWATGNGGRSQDDCSCDGYTSSIYTLSIGSISPGGYCTLYDEKCPSTMGVVYTGDIGESKRESYGDLVTTSLFNQCVESFSGTSCAAPLAAGVFALVLQANPDLTWRDMQHLVVETALKNDPQSSSWNTNAAGHSYNNCYGFGVLNALSLVKKAKNWKHVGPQMKHEVVGELKSRETREIKSGANLILKLNNDDNSITKLEHVQLVLSVTHRRRGDLVIDLTSPQGTTSRLLAKRPQDDATYGLDAWPFTSVEFWGENPQGEWTLKISDEKSDNNFSPRNSLFDILLDEEKSTHKDKSFIQNDFGHGRLKEDYLSLTTRSRERFSEERDEPNYPREFQHGRFKEDYMKLKEDAAQEKVSEKKDEPNFPRELAHGRFKEDYMKLKADSNAPSNVDSDESECSPSGDLEGPVAGCVTQWSLVTYGTA